LLVFYKFILCHFVLLIPTKETNVAVKKKKKKWRRKFGVHSKKDEKDLGFEVNLENEGIMSK